MTKKEDVVIEADNKDGELSQIDQIESNYQKYVELAQKYRDLAQQCLGALTVLRENPKDA